MMTCKNWGTSQTVFRSDSVEVILLNIAKGEFSSIHHHNDKHNLFKVISGEIMLCCGDPSRPDKLTEHFLTKGDAQVQVPKGIKHGFKALQDSIVLEIYYLDTRIDPKDMVISDIQAFSDAISDRSTPLPSSSPKQSTRTGKRKNRR